MLNVLLASRGIVYGSKKDGFARLVGRSVGIHMSVQPKTLTAYAMRSPLGSEESCVGRPRSVLGEAARILSIVIDMFGRGSAHPISGKE